MFKDFKNMIIFILFILNKTKPSHYNIRRKFENYDGIVLVRIGMLRRLCVCVCVSEYDARPNAHGAFKE